MPSPRCSLGQPGPGSRPRLALGCLEYKEPLQVRPNLLLENRNSLWPGTIRQYGKTINISCQFTYSFFNLFLIFLLAYRFYQYVSCIYYIYLYISTMPPLRAPTRLNGRLKQWQESSKPRKWTIGPLA